MPDKSLDGANNLPVDGKIPPVFGGAIADSDKPDPHGRAALLLVESLIHGLLDKAVLTRGEALDIIDIATEVERDLAAATDGGTPPRLQKSLLAPLGDSLRQDGGA